MINKVRLNKVLGWILLLGITVTQLVITKITIDIGRMAPFYAFLSAIVFLPFIVTGIAGVLSREGSKRKIKILVAIGIFFQVALPCILPLFFDRELIYWSLIGIVLGLILWSVRDNIELQLLIVNGIGIVFWLAISFYGLKHI